MGSMFLTIPTIMTWARIAAIPFIVGVFYLPEPWMSVGDKNLAATLMFVLFAATDWLDGYLARQSAQSSSAIHEAVGHPHPSSTSAGVHIPQYD